MAPVPAILWRNLRVHQIYGANTEVGKTIFSTILCRAAGKYGHDERISYLKPVSTGPESESDSLCEHLNIYAPSVTSKTLFQYEIACSPHSAAEASSVPTASDNLVLQKIYETSSNAARSDPGWLFVETAGGVHSPAPSGTTQAELYAPLRTPVILVGDSKLGGISQTISAFESLKLRGYSVEAILMLKGQYENHRFLEDYFHSNDNDVVVEAIADPPERHADDAVERSQMETYYQQADESEGIKALIQTLDHRSKSRIARLQDMAPQASKIIWYPFTQQKLLTPNRITAIDSAHGDFFQTLNANLDTPQSSQEPVVKASFDGSASWWTQGLGHANSQLTLAAAHAAGRYGHVMFAEGIHEPALSLAQRLLGGMDNPRLSRVFYTDNGSTGCEVAVKMGLRAARSRYGWSSDDKLNILGLKGSYHGDTIGAMDCSDPNPYNKKVEWYDGKGYWFDPPSLRCYEGKWHIDVPETLGLQTGGSLEFDTLEDALNVASREKSALFQNYRTRIEEVLEGLAAKGLKFGALMLEPVVLGAGGMVFVDPLFQKALVDSVRNSHHLWTATAMATQVSDTDWTGLPVIFDEVFTGLYRLGRFSSASFLDTHPDISVHAKLLTGGLIPLCATLASEAIFDVFQSDDKTDALLHGHSYTAHPIGCQVAVESLKELQAMDSNGSWDWAKERGWNSTTTQSTTGLPATSEGNHSVPQTPWSIWPKDFIDALSWKSDRVTGVWALGSVLAITMRADDGAGYTSKAATGLQAFMRNTPESWNAHTRILGNVFYIMASQKTEKETIDDLARLLLDALK